MATVFRPLERLRVPRPSLHPGVTGSGSACCRCTLGGTRGRTPGRREGGREGGARPQRPLSLEKARAPFPLSCPREQPGLLGGCEPLRSVPGKQRQLESKSLFENISCFLFCKVLVRSLRDGNPSCAPYVLRDSRQASSSPKLFLTVFLKISNA